MHYKEHNVYSVTADNQDVTCQRLWIEGEQFPAQIKCEYCFRPQLDNIIVHSTSAKFLPLYGYLLDQNSLNM